MAVDKLVDSTQLNSDLTSIANAIRTKGGTSAQLAFPSGFVSAIGDIPSGGGDSGQVVGDYFTLKWAKVTAGANTVSNGPALLDYLLGLAGADTSTYIIGFYCIVDEPSARYNNMSLGSDPWTPVARGGNGRKFYRYKNGSVASTTEGSSYDAVVQSGTKYNVFWLEGSNPT